MLELNRLGLTLDKLTHKMPKSMVQQGTKNTKIAYSKRTFKVLKESLPFYEENALKQIYSDIISLRKTTGNHTDKIVKDITNGINKEFRYDFNWIGVDQVLDTNKKEIVEILPYLLTSYIISYKANKLLPNQTKNKNIEDNGFDEIFTNIGEVTFDIKTNYYKNVKSYTQKFSMNLSQSKKIVSLSKKVELYKQQYSRYVKYILENDISPFEECELKKPCEKTIGPIELTLIPWNVTFIKCISICKNIQNVNFTLSTALFTLSVLNLLDNIDESNAIFNDSSNTDPQELSNFEDYLKQNILKHCCSLVEQSHQKFNENQIASLLAMGINLDELDMNE